MRKIIFTGEQIKELLKNPNVVKCSEEVITYGSNFKVTAAKLHVEHGVPVKEIFIRAGFDLAVIGENIPRKCLERWCKIYRTMGAERLATECRGKMSVGRTKTKKLLLSIGSNVWRQKMHILKLKTIF